MALTEKDYIYWLFNVPGIGRGSADKLLCGGRSCMEIYEMSERQLGRILTAKQVDSIINSKKKWNFEAEQRKLEEKGIRFISRIESDFPEKLKNIPNPPFAIYVRGDLPDPNEPSAAIIGARMCSDYGRFMARKLGQELAMAGVQIISGLAKGVDGISQKAAILAGGKSFGVMGCGADICYPEENIDIYNALTLSGGIISEYPIGTLPRAGLFPIRNRIISALSDVVLVVEARLKSGTQITVDTALEQGREVLALPGRVTDRLSDGCNYMISQGAGIVLDTEDVIDRLKSIRGTAAGSRTFAEDDVSNTAECDDINACIKNIVGVIPVSMSFIMDELSKLGYEIQVPELMERLFGMVSSGEITQNGAYYSRNL